MCCDHPMTWDYDWDRVAPVGLANRSRSPSCCACNGSIGPRLAVWNGGQSCPNSSLIDGPVKLDRQLEMLPLAIQILMHLIPRAHQQRSLILITAPTPVDGDNRPVFF